MRLLVFVLKRWLRIESSPRRLGILAGLVIGCSSALVWWAPTLLRYWLTTSFQNRSADADTYLNFAVFASFVVEFSFAHSSP